MSLQTLLEVVRTAGAIISPFLIWYLTRRYGAKITNLQKEINGKMEEHLKTTKALGHAEGVAEEKKENNKNNPI